MLFKLIRGGGRHAEEAVPSGRDYRHPAGIDVLNNRGKKVVDVIKKIDGSGGGEHHYESNARIRWGKEGIATLYPVAYRLRNVGHFVPFCPALSLVTYLNH